VQPTPAFFLGVVQSDGAIALKKRINGALPFDEFRAAIMNVIPQDLKQRVGPVALNVR
jgi:hypothetical protein